MEVHSWGASASVLVGGKTILTGKVSCELGFKDQGVAHWVGTGSSRAGERGILISV